LFAEPLSASQPRHAQERKPTDVHVVGAELYFLPVETRVPLRFGGETLTSVTCARARVVVANRHGKMADGWGETPLSVQWTWPSSLPYKTRHAAMQRFCRQLALAWVEFNEAGHALELGDLFNRTRLASLRHTYNHQRPSNEQMPMLAALACCSPFDIALHDAYGNLAGLPVYQAYGPDHLSRDLSHFLESAPDSSVDFRGKFPSDFLLEKPALTLPVWHLVGGLDPLTPEDVNGGRLADGYPASLTEWIERDGLKCLKVKLRGDDFEWDYDRTVKVGRIAQLYGVKHLTSDFNCMVQQPAYVTKMLDRLQAEEPVIYEMIMYVEQPFPADIESFPIKVQSI
jgi:L-alanine-DL-glutamate epimerase-like enolase superfamily enzyme